MLKFPAEFGALFSAFDFKALIDIQQKNLDAFVAANTKLAEGAQAVLKRQTELMQSAIEAARDNFSPSNATKVEKHVEFVKASTEQSVSNAREIAEIVSKSGNEAIEILRKRAEASVGEIGRIVKTAA